MPSGVRQKRITSDPFELGWVTGFVDGECHPMIRFGRTKTKYLGERIRFYGQLVVENTNREMVERFKHAVGYTGKIGTRDRAPNSMIYDFNIGGPLLRELLPLIKDRSCRREELEILLELVNMSGEPRRGWKGHWGQAPTSVARWNKMNDLRNRLLDLHEGRGPPSKRHPPMEEQEFEGPPPETWRKAVSARTKGLPERAEEIRRLYWDEEVPVSEIAVRVGTGERAVYATMERYGIPRRSRSEAFELARSKIRDLK